MPSAVRYEPPYSSHRESSYTVSVRRRDREERYKKALRYYNGEQSDFFDKPQGQPDDNVVVNLVQITADRTLSFLFADMPTFEISPEQTEQTEEEKWLEQAWDANQGLSFLHKIALNGFLSGHVYVRVLPPDEIHEYPRLIALDPTSVNTYWRADDLNTVLWHEIRWQVGDELHILDVIHELPRVETREVSVTDAPYTEEQLIDLEAQGLVQLQQKQMEGSDEFETVLIIREELPESWRLIEYVSKTGNSRYEKIAEDDWDSPLPPVIHWQHLPNPNRFYGKSEADNLNLQDTVNFLYSSLNRIIRFHAHPRTVAFGVEAEEIVPTAIDHMWAIDNTDARIDNLELRSELTAAQAIAQTLLDVYLSEKRVVVLRGEVRDFQRVTNAGVRTVFIDSLSKNVILRKNYAYGLSTISKVMMMVTGMTVPDKILVQYKDPLPMDDKEAIDVLAIENSLGIVSKETMAAKRGYAWEEEAEKKKSEVDLPFAKHNLEKLGQEQTVDNNTESDTMNNRGETVDDENNEGE